MVLFSGGVFVCPVADGAPSTPSARCRNLFSFWRGSRGYTCLTRANFYPAVATRSRNGGVHPCCAQAPCSEWRASAGRATVVQGSWAARQSSVEHQNSQATRNRNLEESNNPPPAFPEDSDEKCGPRKYLVISARTPRVFKPDLPGHFFRARPCRKTIRLCQHPAVSVDWTTEAHQL